jgi:hypothetical protein
MAFVRVVADVRVDFGGMRAPIERKGLEVPMAPGGRSVSSTRSWTGETRRWSHGTSAQRTPSPSTSA